MQLNPAALEKAKALIDEGKFRINTPWREVQPSPTAEDKYLAMHGWDAYAQWYLAVNPQAAEGTKERYLFPVGDFNAVHRSGIVAAKSRAEKEQNADLAAAAEEILDLFDRLNAC